MTIDEMIDIARRHKMTPAELWDQRVSFSHGNVAIENPDVTREMTELAAVRRYGPRPE